MKLPRNQSGTELAKALHLLGYQVTRQKGSPIRLTTKVNGIHHEVVPAHKPLKTGTLANILKSVARHHRMTTAELIDKLDL